MDSVDKDSVVGTILDGRYRIICRLSQSGTNVVYKAEHQLMKRLVAIKLLQMDLKTSQDGAQHFLREARTLGMLEHPNVIGILDSGVTADGLPYLVMDYKEGQNLSTLIEAQGGLTPNSAVEIFLQVCEGLQNAHSKGIIHRDLKPANIMLVAGEEGAVSVKIVDLGIAKLISEQEDQGQKLTGSGMLPGTPLYMSPEQLREKKLDPRSDIYSMGCVMYETLCGRVPFPSDKVMAIDAERMYERPKSFSERRPDMIVPAKLEMVIFKALERDPAQRQQSMQELKSELEEVAVSEAANNTSSPVTRDAGQRPTSANLKPRTIKTLAVAILLVVAAGGLQLYLSTSSGAVTLARAQLYIKAVTVPNADPKLLGAMSNLIDAYVRNGQIDDAEILGDSWLEITKNTYKPQSVEAAYAYDRLAGIYSLQGKEKDKVIEYYKQSTNILLKRAIEANNSRQYNLASQLLEELLTDYTNATGPNTNAVAVTIYLMACNEQSHGEQTKDLQAQNRATALYNRVLKMRGNKVRVGDEWVAQSLAGLGQVNYNLKNYKKAVEFDLKALAFCREQMAPKNPVAITVLAAVESHADSFAPMQEYSSAEQLYKGVLASKIAIWGPDNASVGKTAFILANLYRTQFKGALELPANKALASKAVPLCERALAICEKARCQELVSILDLLATCEYSQGRYAEAAHDWHRTLSLYEKSPASGRNRRADTLKSIGEAYCRLGRYSEAELEYKQALSAFEQENGPHSVSPGILQQLADCEYHEGKQAEALTHCRQAGDSVLSDYNRGIRKPLISWQVYLDCMRAMGHSAEAKNSFDRIVKAYRHCYGINGQRKR